MAKLGEYLVKEGLITEGALHAALSGLKEPDRLGTLLVARGALSEESLARALERQSGSPLLDLEKVRLDPGVGSLVPWAFAERTRSVPIRVERGCLYVGAVDPTNVVAWDELATLTGLTVRIFTARESQVLAAWRSVYPTERESTPRTPSVSGVSRKPEPGPPLAAIDIDALTASLEDDVELASDGDEDADSAVVQTDSRAVKLVHGFIQEAAEKGASDIHIEPFALVTRVRYRIDGVLQPRVELPRSHHRMIVSRIKVMAQLDIAERRLPQDGRVRLRVHESQIDLRVSSLPTTYGEKVVIRLLGGAQVPESLDRLGLKVGSPGTELEFAL